MKPLLIFFFLLCLYGSAYSQGENATVKDSVFRAQGLHFTFPKDTGWIAEVLYLDGKRAGDSTANRPFKVTVFPEKGRIHAFITIQPGETKLNGTFESFTRSVVAGSEGLTILDTTFFYHQGQKAFEIVWKWKDPGAPVYTFQRNWYISGKDQLISTVSFEGDAVTYFRYSKTAKKIMRSVHLE